jgi:hypothetical protein
MKSSDVKAHWDRRYAECDAVYGREPNAFFRAFLSGRPPGTMLLPADGEGRNGVHAARCGWNVQSFDASSEGVKKSHQWAENAGLERTDTAGSLQAEVAQAKSYSTNEQFDVLGLFYFHQQDEARRRFHARCTDWIRPGGLLVLEGFGPGQLTRGSGGPSDLAMLFTEKMLREDFSALEIVAIGTFEVDLDEGPFHQGAAEVVRLIARQKPPA